MRSNVEMYMPAKATTAYDLPAHYVPKPLQCSGACAGWNQILFHFFLFYVFFVACVMGVRETGCFKQSARAR